MNQKHTPKDMNRPALVWHLGQSGIGAELNLLVLANLYAIQRNYDFWLVSRGWNATVDSGWNDYFKPFCLEPDYVHLPATWRFMHPSAPQWMRLKLEVWKAQRYFKRKLIFDYEVAGDIWNHQFSRKKFRLPGNSAAVSCETACRHIAPLTIQLNSRVAALLQAAASRPEFKQPYFCVHIRRGDKVSEAVHTPISEYFLKAQAMNDLGISRCFLMTDDYAVVDEARRQNASLEIFGLTDDTRLGHDQATFNRSSVDAKQNNVDTFLVEVGLAVRAIFFVGTMSSNVGRLIALLRPDSQAFGVDGPFAMVW